MAWLTASVVVAIVGVLLGILSERVVRLFVDHWIEVASAVLLANLAAMTIVRVSGEGVRVGRFFLVLARARAPLDGVFVPNLRLGKADEGDEPDIERWFSYRRDGKVAFSVRCLRPEATAEWLNAQLQRVQALDLPPARVVEQAPAGNDGAGRGIE